MKKDNIKLSIFWVFSFLFIIFMITFTSHASTYYNTDYFPMEQNENDVIPQDLMDYMESYLDSENNYIFIAPWGNGYYWYAYSPKNDGNIYAEVYSTEYQFKLYTTSNSSHGGYIAWWYGENAGIWDTGFNYINNGNPFNSSIYDSSMSYVSNFRIYTNDFDNEVVLMYGSSDPVLDVGVAIIPPGAFIPEYPSGNIPPTQVPLTYTPSDYTWTTPPTFDGSSVEAALGSIQNVIGWLANNLKEEFKNLIDNLKGFFKYIGDTIQYYGNAIIETLNNFIQNFYDNMAALVQPIFEKIAYITTPLEATVIWDNISTTSLVTNVNTIKTSLTSFQGAFTGVSEPNEYKIPIHLENLPSSWFGTQTTQYIDLGIINGTVKDGLRLFVWAMFTYGLVVTIFDSIANYINGGGDES